MRRSQEKGQTLVDALMGLSLVTMISLSIANIAHMLHETDTLGNITNDIAALYQELSAIVSTPLSCTKMLASQNWDAADLSINKLDLSNNVSQYLTTYATNPETSIFGNLIIQGITLQYAYDAENNAWPEYNNSADLELIVNISSGNYQRTIRGIFLTALLNSGTTFMTGCGPIVGVPQGATLFETPFPTCSPSYQAPTSKDGVYIECDWIRCPDGSAPFTNSSGGYACN